MAISGSLEDVGVADVLRFIALGRRTGVLHLERAAEVATLSFCEGRIVRAGAADTAPLGEQLIASGRVAPDAVAAALAAQQQGDQRSLGRILVAAGLLDEATLHDAVVEQIALTVRGLLSWDVGTFDFRIGDAGPGDGIAATLFDTEDDETIDTEYALLEAARTQDECGRRPSPPPHEAGPELAGPAPETRGGAVAAPPTLGTTLLLCSRDPLLVALLRSQLAGTVTLEVMGEGGDPAAEMQSPDLLLIDARGGRQIATVLDQFPMSSAIAIVEGGGGAPVTSGQVTDVVGADPAAILTWVRTQLRRRRARRDTRGSAAAVSRLSRGLRDLRSGLLSATVALHLMQVTSEHFERGILFVVQGAGLWTAGAFGDGADGVPLVRAARGLRLDLAASAAFERCVRTGELAIVRCEPKRLPAAFARVVGLPSSGQAVLVPVPGAASTVAVVYADNGESDEPIPDLTLLELAAAQVGMAFENELLRLEVGRGGERPALDRGLASAGGVLP